MDTWICFWLREYIILKQPDDLEKAEELASLKEAVKDERSCFSKEVFE